jgi:hypothetical protein
MTPTGIEPALESKLYNLEAILIPFLINLSHIPCFSFHSPPTVTADTHKHIITQSHAQFSRHFSYQSPEVKTKLIRRKFHLTSRN